jgi:peptide-methionine (S)-S-oxide reductase
MHLGYILTVVYGMDKHTPDQLPNLNPEEVLLIAQRCCAPIRSGSGYATNQSELNLKPFVMKWIQTVGLWLVLFLVTMGSSCAQDSSLKIPKGSRHKMPGEQVATFSEGCFWHSELIFQSLVGVRDAVSGYSGGTTKWPTYEDVETGTTGYAESVNVYYDSSKISYALLVKAFFASQDPTTPDRQGNDVGTQYRSIAFYRTPQEKQIIEAEIQRLTEAKAYPNPIVTQVVPFSRFYPAEDEHQEYIYYHANNPYVAHVCIPEWLAFKKSFKDAPLKQ